MLSDSLRFVTSPRVPTPSAAGGVTGGADCEGLKSLRSKLGSGAGVSVSEELAMTQQTAPRKATEMIAARFGVQRVQLMSASITLSGPEAQAFPGARRFDV